MPFVRVPNVRGLVRRINALFEPDEGPKGRREEELVSKLRKARERIEAQEQRAQKQRNALAAKDRRLIALESSATARRADARRHVHSEYGYEGGLPEVDLLKLLPGLDETIEPYTFLEGQALVTDIALLKGLARMSPGCRYLEIGSWRGDYIANVAAVARECVSVSLSEEELRELGLTENFVLQHGLYSADLDNVRHLETNSKESAFTDLERSFDLVFVDGGRKHESVETDTRNAFRLLKDDQSVVVWHDYGSASKTVNWETFAGILDGCSREQRDDLYHVSNTLCAVYVGRNKDLPGREEKGYALPGKTLTGYKVPDKTFRVRVEAWHRPARARVRERKLAIVDDVFPHMLSAFRIAEYNAYLERWKNARVYTTTNGFRTLREEGSFDRVLEEYSSRFPLLGDRVVRVDSEQSISDHLGGDELLYTVFLYNAFRLLDLVHERDLPFAFTLYPGGRFRLDQEESDHQLRSVCSSPNLEKVIATQKITYEYLLEKKYCSPEKVEFVYGGVFPADRLHASEVGKKRYKEGKDTFDVCFVAHKYTERGADKGYDVFVEVAKLLSREHDDVVFHVVGSFDESDIDVGSLGDRIRFYGTRNTEFLSGFYSDMDAILSPNVPFVLQPGAFDGFPTGGCIEAGLSGVAVFCTDPLKQNVSFEEGEEVVIVPRDPEAITESLSWYHARPGELRELATKGQRAFRRVFGPEVQLGPRLRTLSSLMEKRTAGGIADERTSDQAHETRGDR